MSKKILVVVDAQNDFVKGGVLPFGYPEQDNTQAIISKVNDFIRSGYPVIATQDTHNSRYSETLEGKILKVPHCIIDTNGWELISPLDEYAKEGRICIIRKPTFGTLSVSAYIDSLIHGNCEDYDEIHICGYCSSICVAANAVILRAMFPDTRIIVFEKLCGDIDKASHDAAMRVLANQQIEIA